MRYPNRVVVTGMGQVSALGAGVDALADGVFAGRSGIGLLDRLVVPGLERPLGGAIPVSVSLPVPESPALRNAPRIAQLAWAAADQAFTAAGLDRVDRRRGGVYVGTGFGALATVEETYRHCYTTAGGRPRPNAIPSGMANLTAGLLAADLRLKGPNLTLCVACSSSSHAIGQAFHLLRSGGADLMLAGGADTPLTEVILGAWNALRVLAPAGDDPAHACRPFSADRAGLVVGEGAAFLILETLAHAEGRGAEPLAEVVGYGANADAGHITHPDADGVLDSMRLALADAAAEPEELGYINAHGTATAINDRVESEAIQTLLGAAAGRVPLSSTKAVHAHAMGASGALEAMACVLALGHGRLPPTGGLGSPDPALPALDYIVGAARKSTIDLAMSNSFAFGGSNAVLVFRRA